MRGWEAIDDLGNSTGMPAFLLMDRSGFDYAPFDTDGAGTPLEYPQQFSLFGFTSELILVRRTDEPIDIIFTVDGVTEEPERTMPQSGILAIKAIGFKAKRQTLFATDYTLIAFR